MKKIAFAALIAAFFATAASATVLTGKLNVDNSFAAYYTTNNAIQGTLIASGNDWTHTYLLSQALTTGTTGYLHIKAVNSGGPGGFLGAFTLSDAGFKFANNTQTLLTGDSALGYNTTGWSNAWSTPVIEGVNGVGPWGTMAAYGSSNPDWVWKSQTIGRDDFSTVYFSAKLISTGIVVDNNLPEPGSLALIGLGLAGLAGLRKRRAA